MTKMFKFFVVFLFLLIGISGVFYYLQEKQPLEKPTISEAPLHIETSQEKVDRKALKRAQKQLASIIKSLEKRNNITNEDIVRILKTEFSYDLPKITLVGDKKIVSAFIRGGADVNALKEKNRTALHEAVFRGNIEMVRFLINKNANVNEGGQDNWTSLMEASYYGYSEIAALLIDHGANMDVSAKTNDYWDGWFALAIASSEGHSDVVSVLLTHGADPHQKISRGPWVGWFPLALATLQNQPAVVKLLLDYGANSDREITRGDWVGWTPREIANTYGYEDVLDLF